VNTVDITLRPGDTEIARFSRSGGTQAIGFFGHATAAQQTPTGSRGGNAALASLLTALAASGLIVDGTSA